MASILSLPSTPCIALTWPRLLHDRKTDEFTMLYLPSLVPLLIHCSTFVSNLVRPSALIASLLEFKLLLSSVPHKRVRR